MAERYDLVIVGSGPAGLAAAIYAQRARLRALVLEKDPMSGGQVLNTYEVDNYPGLPGIGGFDLGMKLREHADRLGAVFAEDEVQKIVLAEAGEAGLNRTAEGTGSERGAEESGSDRKEPGSSREKAGSDREDAWAELRAAELSPEGLRGTGEKEPVERMVAGEASSSFIWKNVIGRKASYLAKTVIIASGAAHRRLDVPGEKEFAGMGVSYCATCDGAFFRDRTVAVVGGGDVALEDAVFLSRMCRRVYLIHRRDRLRGARSLQEKLFSLDNVTVLWDSVVERIVGEDAAEALDLKNVKTRETSRLPVDGVFIAVGITPNSQPFEGFLEMDHGYIRAGEDGRTSIPGVFAAGDVRTKQLRQIVTAVADGANAVASAERYLTEA